MTNFKILKVLSILARIKSILVVWIFLIKGFMSEQFNNFENIHSNLWTSKAENVIGGLQNHPLPTPNKCHHLCCDMT